MTRWLKSVPHRLLPSWRHPARVVVTAFAYVVAAGTALLMLPAATESGESPDFVTALFTATSSVCVTGLIVADTPGYWSTFGELVIIALVQVGGLGIMTLASLLGLLITRRIGLRMRLTAQTESKALESGDMRRVLAGVALVSITFETITAVVLTARFASGYGYDTGSAVYHGVFHAISAFNNAGFALYPDSLTRFVTDPWICVTVSLAVIAGGLGFPVWIELWRHSRGSLRRWSLHAKITLSTTASLLVLGTVAITALEWNNPDTLGRLGVGGRLLAGSFHAVMPRSAGYNTLEVGEFESGTLLVNDILMFIGGGSAGTAGGIKVTTFALLAFVVLTEIRGEPTVHVMGRKVPSTAQRQALAVALLSVGTVLAVTLCLLVITPFGLDAVLFEVLSAFATVGLSTGITPHLPDAATVLLTLLMFLGRIGPITLASALALQAHRRHYELPEERPIVG